ncbi:MAG: VanZ family protein [Candidatus Alcyoniella australis]|nr:VanZ family protein [Candidatus Alcyoniella australis]
MPRFNQLFSILRGSPAAWLYVLAAAVTIFVASSLESTGVRQIVAHQDKLLHCAVYAVLGLLLARALGISRNWNSSRALLLTAALLSVAYGLSDELHQSFVPTRHCDAWDLAADALGAAIGAALYVFISARPRAIDKGRAAE